MPQRLHPQERLDRAYSAYLAALAAARSVNACPTWLEEGTRCQLLEGHTCHQRQPHVHDANCGGLHRHRPAGLAVGCLTWSTGQ